MTPVTPAPRRLGHRWPVARAASRVVGDRAYHAPLPRLKRLRRITLAAAALAAPALSACRPVSPTPAPVVPPTAGVPARLPAEFPAGWRFAPGREAVFAPSAMVASNSELASQAGVEILRQGGNAVDAAVAVGFALAVTYPVAGNLGGGGFMVIRLADGRTAALDYREVAPLAASRDMYLDSTGALTDRSLVGHLASGVPGAVAGMTTALARFGTMDLSRVIEPAIRLASDGFSVDSALHRSLRGDSALITRFAGRDIFFPGGRPLEPGTRLTQPDLARTLRLIAAQGSRAFYDGEVAELIATEMRRGGGLITREDLRRYQPVWRDPVRTTYRGYTVIGMPPSSSGGTTMVETLNILETFRKLPPFASAAYRHLLAEAFRRAFIDRNTKLGDPAFVAVPVAELTSKAYARTLSRTIDERRASKTPVFPATAAGTHTTHYSVVDAAGNAVATTTTINGGYGSGVVVTGAGFFLNNEMDDFAAAPGRPNMFGLVQGEQNAIEPGKRMLSAMSPTIVLDPSGRLLLVVGAAGGPRIITATTQVILNVIDHRMTLADAMAAPRIHHQAWPDSLRFEAGGLSQAAADTLAAMGHGLSRTSSLANVNAIMRVRGGWHGVHEPRGSGGAVGY